MPESGTVDPRPRVAFVNGGILGLRSYATWLRHAFDASRDLHAEHLVLTENLTTRERIIRRLLCAPLLPDISGLHNADLSRFRCEYNAGLVARRRLLAQGLDRFDVLHFHRQATAYASLDLMLRTPSIVSIDCTQACVLNDTTSAIERMSLRPNVRRDGEIFRRAAAIVAMSRWAEADVRRMYPDCTTPIVVMPQPVRMDLLDAAWADERRQRRGTLPRCLFMGGDFPRKGGPLLLDAWTAGGFAARATLTIVSDWSMEEPLPPGVTQVRGIVGQTPEWTAIWREADLFVMPTQNEAFGLVYQEAGAASLPAIGTRLNAIPEIIRDGETGILVDREDRGALVGALDRLIGSAELRDRLGRAARAKMEMDADPAAHRRRLLALITQVAGRHG